MLLFTGKGRNKKGTDEYLSKGINLTVATRVFMNTNIFLQLIEHFNDFTQFL